MAKNTVPEAKDVLNRFKMEAASDIDVYYKRNIQQE
ncbi:MAG: small, acid-soluble spore protein, alpha/beta type [Ruminococcaceae bacterium]|nr:small, acid-soluble spore protein, alpha/beta type [Oscillospiraceae bacterium]